MAESDIHQSSMSDTSQPVVRGIMTTRSHRLLADEVEQTIDAALVQGQAFQLPLSSISSTSTETVRTSWSQHLNSGADLSQQTGNHSALSSITPQPEQPTDVSSTIMRSWEQAGRKRSRSVTSSSATPVRLLLV